MRRFLFIILCSFTLVPIGGILRASDIGTISGRVLSSQDSILLSEATVYLRDLENKVIGTAVTSDVGRFVISAVPGRYMISAEKESYIERYFPTAYRHSEAGVVEIFPNQNVDIIFRLEFGGWIGGMIETGDRDLSRGLITALKVDQPDAGWYKSVECNGPYPDEYILSGLIPGVYKILARGTGMRTVFFPDVQDINDAQLIEVESGEGVSDITFWLEPAGLGSLAGRVIDVNRNEGIAQVPVLAFQWRDFLEDPNLYTTLTDGDGHFEFELPEGDYYLYVNCEFCIEEAGRIAVFYNNQYDILRADLLTISEGEEIENLNFAIDFDISYELSISGQIIDEGSGNGLGNVTATVIDYSTGNSVASSFSSSAGEFSLDYLPSGQYLLMFSGAGIIPYFYFSTQSWQDAEIIDLHNLSFRGIQSEAITQDYGNMGLAINGTVSSASGPLAGARVYAIPDGSDQPAAYATTNASGGYSIIRGLIPGDFTVICDIYQYYGETYPDVINLDLLTHPVADDIDFYLENVMTAVGEEAVFPAQIEIEGNYPNPFNGSTIIRIYSGYNVDKALELTIYNLLGQEVGSRTLSLRQGLNLVEWGAGDFEGEISSGLYFYKVEGIETTYRMVFLK